MFTALRASLMELATLADSGDELEASFTDREWGA
jgi:hypothetical protein